MTGEMGFIDQDGKDSNGDHWELHAKIAKAVGGELRPFDVYQGPYILVDGARLWVCADDNHPEIAFRVYREDTEESSEMFWYDDYERAIEYAKELLERRLTCT
jgi:hypothetical protein